jgi:phenylacetate-CoA ligase
MPFWDEKTEFMERNQLEKLQLDRLRLTVAAAYRADYYRRVFDRLNLTPESIRSLDQLSMLPLSSKDDLRSGRPEQFLAVPLEKVVRVHVSSGTTGTPTAIYHTQADIDNWADLVARCLAMVGVTPSDVFQNMVGYGLFTGGLGLHYGAERLGTTVIPVGVGNSRRQINLMKQFSTTLIHIIPSYALQLLDKFVESGVDPKTDIKLRLAVIGAEPHTESTRRRIETAYGIKAINSYGLSEMNGPGVAFECLGQEGLHVWEDNYLLEVLNPETLEPVTDGDVGEIVMTTLCREAMPLIRYRTRDLARVIPEVCPCGRTHRRLSRIRGRADDMLILKGVNIFPMQVERVLMALPETGGNYVIVLDRQGHTDTMTVRVEMGETLIGKNQDEICRAESKITRLLKDEILISPKVELVACGVLTPSQGKAVRVLDQRPVELET